MTFGCNYSVFLFFSFADNIIVADNLAIPLNKQVTSSIDKKTISMTFFIKILYIVSVLQVLHSGFSSYEFHQLVKNTNYKDHYSLPKDIQLECYIGLALFILTSFLSFTKLQYYPIKPSINNKLRLLTTDQYLKDISLSRANNVHNLIGNDPNGEVTFTPNFVDLQRKRKEISDWLADNSKE